MRRIWNDGEEEEERRRMEVSWREGKWRIERGEEKRGGKGREEVLPAAFAISSSVTKGAGM